jgi:site-specific DNA-methyltransferase (adenine-specific)
MVSTPDKIAYEHPAIFPEALAKDHIISWTNEGDLVFDPMGGSFTTALQAEKLNRKWLSCDISEKYCEIGEMRLKQFRAQGRFDFSRK